MLINRAIPFTGNYISSKEPAPEVITSRWEPPRLEKGDTRASFFYLNDLHCTTDKMSFLKVFSDQFNEKYKDITTFKVSGGDMKAGMGEAFNDITIDFMNSIGLELSAWGNHETDCGLDKFAQQLDRLDTKFIASNVDIERGSALDDYFAPFEHYIGVKNNIEGVNAARDKLGKQKTYQVIKKLKQELKTEGGDKALKQTKDILIGTKQAEHKKILNSCIVEKNGEKFGFIGVMTPFDQQYRVGLEGIKMFNSIELIDNIKETKGNINQLEKKLSPISDEEHKELLDRLIDNLQEQRKIQKEIYRDYPSLLRNGKTSSLLKLREKQKERTHLLKKAEPPSDEEIEKLIDLNRSLYELNQKNKVQQEINELRDRGVNKIVLLSHLGTNDDEKLIPELSGVDIVIEGHDHKVTTQPKRLFSRSNKPVLLVQAGQDGNFAGILDVVFDSQGEVKDYKNDIYKAKERVFEDVTISEICKKYLKDAQEIAELKQPFEPFLEKTKENPLANLFAEALLAMDHKTCKDKNPAEIAFMMNIGKLRKKELKQKITDRNILNFDEWGDRIYKTRLTGQQIIQVLNYGINTSINEKKSGLVHSSNIQYSVSQSEKNGPYKLNTSQIKIIDPNKVINSNSHEENIYQKLNPDSKYTVLLDDLFLNNIGGNIDLEPKNKGNNVFRKNLRRIEKNGEKPEGYKKIEICEWGRADAVIDYIKTLYDHKLDNGETLLDKKLTDNTRIKVIPASQQALREE